MIGRFSVCMMMLRRRNRLSVRIWRVSSLGILVSSLKIVC